MHIQGVAEVLRLLTEGDGRRTTLTSIAKGAGVERPTLSKLKNHPGPRGPHESTLRAIEDSCQMPVGILDGVIAGTVTPEAAAGSYGERGKTKPGEIDELRYRLGNLEGDVAALPAQFQSIERRQQELQSQFQGLESQLQEIQSQQTDVLRELAALARRLQGG